MKMVLNVGLCFTILLPVSCREGYDDGDNNIDIGSQCSVIFSNEYSRPCDALLKHIYRNERPVNSLTPRRPQACGSAHTVPITGRI